MKSKKAHEIIKELRIKHNLTQKELAFEVGLTQQAIALIEAGKRKVDTDLFLKIIDMFDESLLNILNEYGDNDELLLTGTLMERLENSVKFLLECAGYNVKLIDNDFIISKSNKQIKMSYEEYDFFKNHICDYCSFIIDAIYRNQYLLKSYQENKTKFNDDM